MITQGLYDVETEWDDLGRIVRRCDNFKKQWTDGVFKHTKKYEFAEQYMIQVVRNVCFLEPVSVGRLYCVVVFLGRLSSVLLCFIVFCCVFCCVWTAVLCFFVCFVVCLCVVPMNCFFIFFVHVPK